MPTFGGPSPEDQLLTEVTLKAKAVYDEYDARGPLQGRKVLTRACPVCPAEINVIDEGRDTLGIGMSTEAASKLEAEYTEHVGEHDTDELVSVIVGLRQELAEARDSYAQALQTRIAQAPPQPVQYAMNPPGVHQGPPAYQTQVEETRDERERRLAASREAQEQFDPLKATPRYGAELPAGVVGVRR